VMCESGQQCPHPAHGRVFARVRLDPEWGSPRRVRLDCYEDGK
jgi:hypothetical protein